jgi:hypothetical protein
VEEGLEAGIRAEGNRSSDAGGRSGFSASRLWPDATYRGAAPRPHHRDASHPKVPARARYALDVPEPQHVGIAAVALRRAGARLLLHDAGIEVSDPDGNTWKVRFVPRAKSRSVGG